MSVTTTANGDVIVAAMGNGSDSAPTADSGTTLFITDNGAFSDSGQYTLQATAGSQAMSWTVGSDDWGVVVAAFKEVLPVANNPDLQPACGIKVALLLDASNSIGAGAEQDAVRNASRRVI